jgi:hypothetical protein
MMSGASRLVRPGAVALWSAAASVGAVSHGHDFRDYPAPSIAIKAEKWGRKTNWRYSCCAAAIFLPALPLAGFKLPCASLPGQAVQTPPGC